MTREVTAIDAKQPLISVLHAHFGIEQKFRAYPVVLDGKLVGMVDRSILNSLKDEDLGKSLADLLDAKSADSFVLPGDTCRAVSGRLAAEGLERLPVVDNPTSRRVVGIVSRSDLLKPARVLHEEENQRERVFGQPASGARLLQH
jgi:CBS domain-containing protein